MSRSIGGVYRDGKVELTKVPLDVPEGTRVLVTFPETSPGTNLEPKRIDSWDDINKLAREHAQDRGQRAWIYRGQRSNDPNLKTSLERCYERQGVLGANRRRLESELLREFKRAYHQYAHHLPTPDSVVEWLSVMQHHGAPTRLLDFTYSIYVAVYFALERLKKEDKECALWVVDGKWVLNESVEALVRNGKPEAKRLLELMQESTEKICSEVLFDSPDVKSAIPLNPFRLNERLRIQKGVFLVPTDIGTSFMDNLRALPGYGQDDHVVQYILPASVREEAIEALYYMNISRTSLFPGLDGYAQSLGVYHSSFNPVSWS